MENGEIVSKLINKIEPKTLANLVMLKRQQSLINEANFEEKKIIRSKNFRIQSAPSEKFIKGLYKFDVKNKLLTHREKSQSIYSNMDFERKPAAKRGAESLHESSQFLATFNPNSTKNLLSSIEEKKKTKERENEVDCSNTNTPSFHTKHSYESSISTNVDYSFRVKQQKIKDFSFLESNELGAEDLKKNTGFPKNIFQFINKKHKFFV